MPKRKSPIKKQKPDSAPLDTITVLGEGLLAEFQENSHEKDVLESYAHSLRERVQFRERDFVTHFKLGYQALLSELHKQVK